MRIGMLSPLYEAVPPCGYGGTERIVSYLTEELVRRGHDVTLFAAGDSRTTAELVPVCPRGLNSARRQVDPIAPHVLQIAMAIERSTEFDLIHSHCDFRALPFAGLSRSPLLSTNHNRLDVEEDVDLIRRYPTSAVSAISESQRRQLPAARWIGTCYNGIPVLDFPFNPGPGDYLAFVGRLSPEKGPLEAIEVAERTGVSLKIAAKINPWESDYFESAIRPRLRSPLIEFLGELNETDKRQFLADAVALLFPICWPEPFGMVLVEAMATGTPVLALAAGAVPEVVDEGVTGYIGRDVEELIQRVGDVVRLDRWKCRDRVAARFSTKAMTDSYEAVYSSLLAVESNQPAGPRPRTAAVGRRMAAR
jgi:glycosyltransferase involved in cell wall biosynthesis